MRCKTYVSNVLIFCLLSGCASNYQNTIANKKNELQNIDAPNASKLLGGDRDIVFTIEHGDIKIDYALPKLEKDNLAKITQQNKESQESRQVGCIRINDKSFTQCPYSFQSDIFLKDTPADPGYMIAGTVLLPLKAVLQPQNIKASYVRKTIDSEAIQSVGEIINKTIHLELQGIEQSKDTGKMEQFLTKYAVTDKKSSPYQKLISLYRYQNNFDSYLKVYEITGEKDDLRQAYNVATTDYQKKKIEDIAEELQRRELASQAAALAGVALGVMAVKWLFGAIGSAMSAGASSSSSSSSFGATESISTTSSTAQKNDGNYECSYMCWDAASPAVLDFGKKLSNEHKITVSGSDYSSAREKGLKIAKQACKDMGFYDTYSRWGKGVIDCNEKN